MRHVLHAQQTQGHLRKTQPILIPQLPKVARCRSKQLKQHLRDAAAIVQQTIHHFPAGFLVIQVAQLSILGNLLVAGRGELAGRCRATGQLIRTSAHQLRHDLQFDHRKQRLFASVRRTGFATNQAPRLAAMRHNFYPVTNSADRGYGLCHMTQAVVLLQKSHRRQGQQAKESVITLGSR